MFDRLYFKNGTFYVVTENAEEVPDLKLVISSGIYLTSGPADELKRLPTDKELRIIDPDQARKVLGSQAERLDGITVCLLCLSK